MEKMFRTRNKQPSLEGHGWMIEDVQIVIDWMVGLPAPPVVMELIACKCNRVCKAPECQCVTNALKCSPTCKNHLCNIIIDNYFEENDGDTVVEDESDYDDDDDALGVS